MNRFGMNVGLLAAIASVGFAMTTFAQVTPAPPDDTPKFNIGATIFADYTYQQSPEVPDADGSSIHPSSFNVSRAHINVTGNLNHWIYFRITPDVARESGSGASLAGSQEFRLKFAYAQFNLDDWTTKGSWVRLGLHQTPLLDYEEGIYRYRFQGTTFTERIGLLTTSDGGVSGRYVFAGNYGEIHAGYYNGESFTKAEANDEKAIQLRATLRPLPAAALWKGLRLTAFIDDDHYVKHAKRRRVVGQATFEHRRGNAGLDLVTSNDRTSATKTEADGKGWSIWATPKIGARGWELLVRHDAFKPNKSLAAQTQKRDIVGVAYWVRGLGGGKSVAVLADRDSLKRTGLTPAVPKTTNYALHMLINF